MFSVSLMAIDFGSVLLNVLAIIGIIIAGGFVVFFLGDLLISIYDPQNSALKFKKKDAEEVKQIAQPEKPQELTYAQSMKYNPVDYNKAADEEKMLKGVESQPIFYSEPVKMEPEVKPQPVEPVKVENNVVKEIPQSPEDIFAQLRAEEELFKQEKLKAATEHKNVFADVQTKKGKQEQEDEDEFNFDDIFFSDDDMKGIFDDEDLTEEDLTEELENEEEVTEDANVEEMEEVKEEVIPTEPKAIQEQMQLHIGDEELEKLKAQNEELKQQIEKLLQEKNTQPVLVSVETLTKEELEEKLVELNERLKVNEKELRSIKKEYIPLNRVRRTLESDKKKLRRKEALVAKQKIMLYGVNNIADIDQEKAKKLEEDLDLLDGLRLSVQHCEEVIRSSEERYPVLETSYNILNRTIANIKEDIAEVESQLAKASK